MRDYFKRLINIKIKNLSNHLRIYNFRLMNWRESSYIVVALALLKRSETCRNLKSHKSYDYRHKKNILISIKERPIITYSIRSNASPAPFTHRTGPTILRVKAKMSRAEYGDDPSCSVRD